MPAEPLAPARKKTTFARNYAWYIVSMLSQSLAGFVSLPVTSRYLTRADFGILGLFETFSGIWMAVLKLGMQHSLVRFHSIHAEGKPPAEQSRFVTTFVWAPQALSLVLTMLGSAAVVAGSAAGWIPDAKYAVVALVLSQAMVMLSFFQNMFIAEQRSLALLASHSALRWSQTILLLVAVIWIAPTAMSAFAARIVASVLVLAWLLKIMCREIPARWGAFSPKMFREGLHYGVPLALSEVASFIHSQFDRVILRAYLDYAAVGLYHINFSLAQFLGLALFSSFTQAFEPHGNQLYEKEGAERYVAEVRKLLRPLYYLTVSLIVAVIWVGPDALQLIVSREKSSPAIFICATCVQVLRPVTSVLSYGLQLQKRSRAILITLAVSCVVSITSNLILIPRLGIQGAAYSMMLSFGVLYLSRIMISPRETWPIRSWRDLAKPLVMGGVLCLALQVSLQSFTTPLTRLAVAGAVYLFAFLLPSLAIDSVLRSQVQAKLGRLRR